MCYRIESKPVREKAKKREKRREGERKKGEKKKHAQFAGESKVAGG
jgi:hypothetical protein